MLAAPVVSALPSFCKDFHLPRQQIPRKTEGTYGAKVTHRHLRLPVLHLQLRESQRIENSNLCVGLQKRQLCHHKIKQAGETQAYEENH